MEKGEIDYLDKKLDEYNQKILIKVRKAIFNAKKEVFDDIDELIDIDHPLNTVYIKLKQRHLSTFQKKSDIINVLEKKK